MSMSNIRPPWRSKRRPSCTRACAASTCCSSRCAPWSALDTLGQVSSCGAQTFTWLIVLAVFFVLPVCARHGRAGERVHPGGRPVRVDEALPGAASGPASARSCTGSRTRSGSAAPSPSSRRPLERQHLADRQRDGRRLHVQARSSSGSRSGSRSSRSQRGKWIPNVGAIVRVGVLAFFSLTVLIYAIEHGVHGYAFGEFGPSTAVFLASCRCCSSTTSASSCRTAAAEEMVDPQKDVPKTVAAQRDHRPCSRTHSDLRDPGGAAGEQDHGHRRASSTRSHATFGVYGGAADFLVDVMAPASSSRS